MCVCDWTLIIFQDSLALHYLMSTLVFCFFFFNFFFFWCTSTQITLTFFHVSHVSYVSAMLNFKIFFLSSHVLTFNFNFNLNRHA